MDMNLVALADLIPTAILDLRYATPDNVTGQALYAADIVAELVESAAQQLAKAAELFAGQLLRLVIWDAYRPEAVQEQLRAVNADERYVLSESNHTKGLAIDLTLATPDGVYLPMGSDFDDFSERAHTDFVDLTEVERTNRSQLRQVMEQVGFQGWPYEWWHFNYVGSN